MLKMALKNLEISTVFKYHINTVEVSRFFKAIFNMLQDQSKQDQTP